MRVRISPPVGYVLALSCTTIASLAMLYAALLTDRSEAPGYLAWNLFLAWIPFALAVYLSRVLRRKSWSSWEALLVSAAWLLFLPNSFYLVSDFIHLADVSSERILFAAILFSSFIFTGLLLGLSSVWMIHRELRKRLSEISAATVIAIVLLICSVAIYVGRDLRWNSWDILVNPAGVLFDVSERLLHPSQYGQVLSVVVPFFILMLSMYVVAWQAMRMLQPAQSNHS